MGFFESISDTKVYRSLRSIGIPHSVAFVLTGESTVVGAKGTHLPRGLHQSPLLSSLAFDRSLLGSTIRSMNIRSKITVYNDDIIISSYSLNNVQTDFDLLLQAIMRCRLGINTSKTHPPRKRVRVFNMILSGEGISFTKDRVEQFSEDIAKAKAWGERHGAQDVSFYIDLYAEYVYSISRRGIVPLDVEKGGAALLALSR